MKNYTNKRSVQQLAYVMKSYEISRVVVSPGSRNAPMAIQFGEDDCIDCYSIVDERSAAFVAMGMAKASKKPVALCCSSGSAAANYYPAITEAFYQNTPLLILTADRPTDLIDQFDGQTIRQKELFEKHSYGDFQLLADDEIGAEDYNFKCIKTAIEICIEKKGPVHINIPLKEPLYQMNNDRFVFPSIEKTLVSKDVFVDAVRVAEWNLAKRRLILVGNHSPSNDLEVLLGQLAKNNTAVVLTETTSNLKNPKFFSHIDRYISDFTEEDFKHFAPDLLISIGQNVISKKVKQFLRKAQPAKHWHIDPYWQPDTYNVLSAKIPFRAEAFLSKFLKQISLDSTPYFNLWDTLRDKKDARHLDYVSLTNYSDFHAFKVLAEKIPENYVLHFANSATIRYAQLFDFHRYSNFCNRGTSGIDGCTSTAMGYAMASAAPTLLITGDIAFFYDINGLWNNYIPPYTRIVIVNNGEGNIFRIIPGPDQTSVMDDLIATKHHKNAEHLAQHFGFEYYRVDFAETFERAVEKLFKPSEKPKILEINTCDESNENVLKHYFEYLKNGKN